MAALRGCLMLLLVSASLHQRSEAFSQRDVDRVHLTYNRDSDKCKDITDSSSRDDKKTADDACQQAFFALDRIKQNICQNWRDAKCRFIPGQTYRQCSSLVPYYDDSNFIPTPFHECAKNIASEVPSKRVELAQSKKRHRSKNDDAQKSARKRHFSINSKSFGGVGTSLNSLASGGAGSPEGVPIGSNAGSSSGAQTAGSAGSRNNPVDLTEEAFSARFYCPHCPKSYVYDRTLREHLKCHNSDETTCPVCHLKCTLKSNLRIHMENAHPGAPLPERAPRKKRTGPFICRKCGRNYTTWRILQSHEKSHETFNTHCFPCKMTMSSRMNYMRHLQDKHPEDALAEQEGEKQRFVEEKREKCEVCNGRFKNTDALRAHMRKHKEKHKCDTCGEKFTRLKSLTTHKNTAHQD